MFTTSFNRTQQVCHHYAALLPGDRGPIYAETNMDRFPVEPWNTFSLLIFLFTAAYFLWRVRGHFREHVLIVFSCVLMLVGFVGGTTYHACRCDNLWLFMDFIPIALLGLIGGAFFWFRLYRLNVKVFIAGLLLLVGISFAISAVGKSMDRHLGVSLSYIYLALSIVVPAFVVSSMSRWRGITWLISGLLFFSIAILWRLLDFTSTGKALFPMGTHFLWHLLGGAASFAILMFILKLETDAPDELTLSSAEPAL